MIEAEETYRSLSAKGRRVTTDGFSANWSPDVKKLAFSAGVHGYSGVAVFDLATKETELLIIPGKDPRWSPDGKYIAFVRDCQILRLEELTATDRKDQMRREWDEEVWVMNADGTQPRRLAHGGWPCWSQDPTCVYYQSRLDNTFNSISIEGQNAEPKRIMACSSWFPSVSPDGQRVAYVEKASLMVMDLATQASVAQWRVPFGTWGGPAWSPTGGELCLGVASSVGDRTGLWIYQFDSNEPVKVLDSQIMAASWTPDGRTLVFGLRPPYFELWGADLDPNISTIEALGPGQMLHEHWQDMLRLYARRIEADPNDASPYCDRARYYDYLEDRERANADMRRWSAVVSGRSPSDFQVATSQNLRRVIKGPFEYKIVFSVHSMWRKPSLAGAGATQRPVNVNEVPILNVAFGQKPSGSFVQPGCDSSTKTAKKGRCNMKTFQIPILSMSLFGLCLLSGLGTPAAHADFTFGEPMNLGTNVNTYEHDDSPTMPADGLSIFFSSTRLGGIPVYDLFVITRETLDDEWSAPVNLGPPVNAAGVEIDPSISADGLTLVFASDRPGGSGGLGDIWMTTRERKDSPWAVPVNLGPVVNSAYDEWTQSISADALELYFHSTRPGGAGGADLWTTTRATTQSAWSPPVNLGPTVNSPYEDICPTLSPDGLCLMFTSARPGGYGGRDTWITTRASKNDPWRPPVNPGPPLSVPGMDEPGCFSPDGSVLFFSAADRSGGYGVLDIWQAPILPVVDFNGDGKVDIADVVIMIEHWHTDYSLCDIGPFPWGDGFVDAQDLRVLAEYMANNPVDGTTVGGL